MAKIYLIWEGSVCVCHCITVLTCGREVCGCASGGRRGRSQLKVKSSGKQCEEVVARAGDLTAEGPWELSQWRDRSTEEHRWIGSGGGVGRCCLDAWAPLTGLVRWAATCQGEESMAAAWETSCWTGLESARNGSPYPLGRVVSGPRQLKMRVLWIGSGVLWRESCRRCSQFGCP